MSSKAIPDKLYVNHFPDAYNAGFAAGLKEKRRARRERRALLKWAKKNPNWSGVLVFYLAQPPKLASRKRKESK